jgi:predicted amidohydrolase YtcJ
VAPAVPDSSFDVAILGARVYRSPGELAQGDAVGIRGDAIAAIGRADRLRLGIGPRTRVVEAHGRSLLPAFIDSHTHFHRGAVLQRFFLDFETLRPRSVEDVIEAVRDRADTTPDGGWIQGDGLSAARLNEHRLPDRRELDFASRHHPVVLRGIGKHVVAANSLALAAAGIDRTTPEPPGGRIERDDDGEPTGILHERAKLRLDQSDPTTPVPKPTAEERREAIREGFTSLHRAGIGTIHEMVRLPEEADDLAALHAAGELAVRVRLRYRVHESPLSLEWLERLGIRRGLGDDRFRVDGIKVSVDGFCIFRNAAVEEPYAGEPSNTGLLRIEPGMLDDLVARANAQGLNVAIHAVGVRAVDLALDAFERAGAPVAGPHRLEHAYVDVDVARLVRARSLGLVWSTQPAFVSAYAREWLDAFGRERRDRVMPLRRGFELGLTIQLNSDFPCVPFDPLDAIRAAVTRTVDGEAIGADQAIDLVSAWRAYTTTPAEVGGDPRLGCLREGALADLVVFDEDPFARGTDLSGLAVRATMLNGGWVHGERDVEG